MYNKSIQSRIVEPNQSNVKQQEPRLLANQCHIRPAKELVGTKRPANAITNVIQNRNINQHGRFLVSDDDITHYSVILILSQNGVNGRSGSRSNTEKRRLGYSISGLERGVRSARVTIRTLIELVRGIPTVVRDLGG